MAGACSRTPCGLRSGPSLTSLGDVCGTVASVADDRKAAPALVLDRATFLRWDARRGLVAEGPDGRRSVPLDRDLVPLLRCFLRPCRPEEAVERFLGRDGEGDRRTHVRDAAQRTLDALRAAEILVPEATHAGSARWDAVLEPVWNTVKLPRDADWIAATARAVAADVRGRVVVQVGPIDGRLACEAVRAGARRVYVIGERSRLEVAAEVVRHNGAEDAVTVLPGTVDRVTPPEPADVVVFDPCPEDCLADEPLVATLARAHERLLAPGGRLIPRRMKVGAVGVDSPRIASDDHASAHRLRVARHLDEALGLDLSALADRFAEELQDERAAHVRPYEPRSDRALTHATDVLDVDLSSSGPSEDDDREVRLKVDQAGTLNGLATVVTLELDDEWSVTTRVPTAGDGDQYATPPLVTALPARRVTAGDEVVVRASLGPGGRMPLTTSAARDRRA